jgi:hypothetical protein
LDYNDEYKDLESLSTRELQKMLKVALKKVEKLDVERKNNLQYG